MNKNLPAPVWLIARSKGDEHFRIAVQPVKMQIPAVTEGQPQKIDFPVIANVSVDAEFVELKATSDAGLPTEYFINYGPVEVDGDRLNIRDIPPRAKFPIKVSVWATQLGRSEDPKVKTAMSQEQIFFITDK